MTLEMMTEIEAANIALSVYLFWGVVLLYAYVVNPTTPLRPTKYNVEITEEIIRRREAQTQLMYIQPKIRACAVKQRLNRWRNSQ